jgi:hypothetical protein
LYFVQSYRDKKVVGDTVRFVRPLADQRWVVHGLAYLTERRQAVGCDGVLRLGRCRMASWSAASSAWLTVSPPAACQGRSITCGEPPCWCR